MMLLSLIIAASISHICSPFSTAPIHSTIGNSRLYSDLLRDGMTSEVVQSRIQSNSKIEVWLDLRGTSITPKTALELWQTEVQNEQFEETHMQLVPFAKCLVSYDERDSAALSDGVVDVMMIDNDGCSFRLKSEEQSASFGQVFNLKLSPKSMPILPDPLPLIDAYSNGQWILLDTHAWKKIDEEEKLGSLFPLAEIITSMELPGVSGRIGWTCHTKSEVTKSAMWMQCQGMKGSSGASTRTLESGIIIPGDFDANAQVQQSESGAKFVIIVPYDVGLLKSAMSFIHNDEAVA